MSASVTLHAEDFCTVTGKTDPDSLAFVEADWEIRALERGAEFRTATVRMFNSVQNISVIKYPAKKFRTAMLHRPGDQAGTTSRLAEDAGAVFAINAGFFNTKKLIPTVYFRIGKEVYGRSDPNGGYKLDGVVGIRNRRNSRLVYVKCDTLQYAAMTRKCHAVMESGPMLMLDDKVIVPQIVDENTYTHYGETQHRSYLKLHKKRHPRTVIGSDKDGYVYFVVIDGRAPGKADGASIWETARICELLGMTDAMNMDGGGSSALWEHSYGVLNHPCDNKKFDHDGERTVPDIIIAY